MKKFLPLILFCIATCYALQAQIVSIDPPFPTVDDDITVTYNAALGSGELEGVAPVFMHTGVVTEAGGPGSWQYVQGNWGVFDGNVIMADLGNDLHSKTYNIRNFHSIPTNEVVTHLAFVFRNVDGSLEGKTEDYQDIFIPLYPPGTGLIISIASPTESVVIAELGQTIPVLINTSSDATIQLTENGMVLAETTSPTTSLSYNLNVTTAGQHTIIATATTGSETVSDTFAYIINPTVTVAEPPAGTINGVNQIDANTVRLQLWAPWKDYVYVIGDFNNWEPNVDYFMNRSSDNATWWIDISGLDPNEEYAFQYYVDGELRIADPYSEKILDPWNDGYIEETTYPNLKPYPSGQTTGIVTSFQTEDTPFIWSNDNYTRPEKENLVVYEMLLRDFVSSHDFQTITDTLDYLERLGVNAIELMPVSEFEGNESWGYNPSFHMALDKYYGTPEAFKTLVDECHARGIAVILDVVFNHAFSQSPLAQLYWDPISFKPSPANPWLNIDPFHPFNVGSDFNHESEATQVWLDQVMLYWLDEYHIDGYRFDLSKGFTQNYTTDVGVWSQYDASRINLLQRAADVLWSADPDFYVMLEHFAQAQEERELSDYGMLIWGNGNHDYNEASMGYGSNLSIVDYQVPWRDMNDPHLLGYMESHDEERLMYKNLEFGNAGAGAYDITDLETALDREELVAAFFFTIPGPKMIWQFGELGYDFSINRCVDGTINPDCRLSPKPIRWDYYENADRKDLYNVYRALIELKTNNAVFQTTDYSYDLASKRKRINLNSSDVNVAVIGNFDVQSNDISPQFQHNGWWYEYFSGDSINVTDVNMTIALEAGEYRLFIDKVVDLPTAINPVETNLKTFSLSPNPSSGDLHIQLELEQFEKINLILYDYSGRKIQDIYDGKTLDLNISKQIDKTLPTGIYFVQLKTESGVWTEKWVVQK